MISALTTIACLRLVTPPGSLCEVCEDGHTKFVYSCDHDNGGCSDEEECMEVDNPSCNSDDKCCSPVNITCTGKHVVTYSTMYM